jgi:hypothetical protein
MCLSSIEAVAQGLGCEEWEIVTSQYDYLDNKNVSNEQS